MSAELFKRTGSDDFPDRLKVMISGPPKSGKTSFLGTVPNIVIADTEPHANNLQSIAHKNLPYVTVNSRADLQRLHFVLRDEGLRNKAAEQLGMPHIEAVAIDTMDTLQQILKAERLADTRKTEFQRDDWGWLKDEMTQIVRSFTSLPIHVFFTVHVKTSELGKGDDARTIVLPGLQGGIAEEIAGMVGYSLLTFRKQEIRPDGSPFTKYWLRAEGDETYNFLGNRAAGRLPDVIEPTFASLYDAAVAGRRAIANPTQPSGTGDIGAPSIQTAAQTENGGQYIGQLAAEAAQNQGQPESAVAPVAAAPTNGDDEPVNAAALSHVKKVYDGCGLTFPEDIIKSLTLGDARNLVRTWQAVQADHTQGNGSGATPAAEMIVFLTGWGWLTPTDLATHTGAAPAPEVPVVAAVVPDVNGTIEQVLAFAGDDLAKIQEAYDTESARPKPRQTLINNLVGKGARTETQTPVSTPESAPVSTPDAAPAVVTPEVKAADPTDQAETLVTDALAAEVIDIQDAEGNTEPCEECSGPIDDQDIAVLSRTRFGRWLCVNDYIAETQRPKAS